MLAASKSIDLWLRVRQSLLPSVSQSCCWFYFCTPRIGLLKGEQMRLRWSAWMEDRLRSLVPGLEQGSQTQVAEGSKLKMQQENREGGENSKVLAGVGSSPSIAMPGELHGGSRDSGASLSHM